MDWFQIKPKTHKTLIIVETNIIIHTKKNMCVCLVYLINNKCILINVNVKTTTTIIIIKIIKIIKG
jgi:hypothetical protein